MFQVLAYVMFTLIATSVASYIAGRFLKRYTGFLTAFGLALTTLLLLSIEPEVFESGVYEEYSWTLVLPTKLGLRADGLSFTLAFIISFISALASIYSVEYTRKQNKHGLYFCLLSLMAFAMTGAVLAKDLATLFFFWEFSVAIPLFLIAEWGYGDRWSTAMRFFLFSRFGGSLLLVGLALTYVSFGSLDIDVLSHSHQLKPEISIVIVLLMVLGFSVKMAIWPFHGWLPSAYADAPIPVAVLLSGVMSKLGVYGVVRVMQIFHEAICWEAQAILLGLAYITALYGGAMAFRSDDLRKIFAYSSMSHMGYILLGFSTLTTHGHGFSGALLHMVNHVLSKSALFFCVGLILKMFGTADVKQLKGGYRRAPLLFTLAILGALGLIGLPPTIGFWSKDMLLGFSLELGLPAAFLMVIVALLSTAYNLRWIVHTFVRSSSQNVVEKTSLVMSVPILVIVVLALTPPVYMNVLTGLLEVEHAMVEIIPLIMTAMALIAGSLIVYVTTYRSWTLPTWLIHNSATLLNILSLEWVYLGVFREGLLKLADWIKLSLDKALDGFNYFVANSTINFASHMYRSVDRTIDGFNDLLSAYALYISERVRKLQTGVLPYNILAMVLALSAVLLILFMISYFGAV